MRKHVTAFHKMTYKKYDVKFVRSHSESREALEENTTTLPELAKTYDRI